MNKLDINVELLAGVREAEEIRRLRAEVARLRAERDALIEAARRVVGLHDASDGNMDSDVAQDAIDKLTESLPAEVEP